ncbi:hypothetical protein L9F63_014659 [Diploptera punctata]|uniref:FHA domain-containing protein n=1 Tax=Diploptera punctata TaxID=6984 RepID=A0AAD8A7I3_DIPPU|nr:hypothetical protein L9F63_014659 [Diploptera punctata]
METESENGSDNTPLIDQEVGKDEKINECEVKETLLTTKEKVNPDIFKIPQLLIGPRRGKVVGKVRNVSSVSSQDISDSESSASDISFSSYEGVESDCSSTIKGTEYKSLSSTVSPAQKIKENSIPLPYKEPKWGGIPKFEYGFEILKNGQILEKCTLEEKSFYVFGRLSTCDFHLQHPTISRYHAVLQYRSQESEDNPKGFYIYDLGSTHGTFLNKNRIKSNMYIRIQVGHMLKLGCSTRLFVLWGPEDDMEEESELTVTQLKEKRQVELATRELEELEKQRLEEEKAKKEEEQGIDWGMSEDAEEEADLSENPFAATQNEELYVDDPKKTLRGWFEREGYDLEYDVEEKGFGQFLCRVELPIENARGGRMTAEALVKGKKKEAVVQCALEACRILDRYGLLRQATHESKKRKAKDWEADDFYDSDEDTFLDRTGTVELKRQQRMRAAGKKDPEEVVETYDSLVKKHSEVLSQLQELELEHHKVSMDMNKSTVKQEDEEEEDALDAFMMTLSKPAPDKTLLNKIKYRHDLLKQEEVRLRKLVNIAKPANLPELQPPDKTIPSSTVTSTIKKTLPMIAKKLEFIKLIIPDERDLISKFIKSTPDGNIIDGDSNENPVVIINIKYENRKDGSRRWHEQAFVVQCTTELHKASPEFNDSVRAKRNIDEIMTTGNIKYEVPEDDTKTSRRIRSNKNKKSEKRRNRTKYRNKQKNEKNMSDYDPLDPDYSTWVPPEGQTGDGKTKLNEKYGY